MLFGMYLCTLKSIDAVLTQYMQQVNNTLCLPVGAFLF